MADEPIRIEAIQIKEAFSKASDTLGNQISLAATTLDKAADKFSAKPPGSQLSYCGFFLIIVPFFYNSFAVMAGFRSALSDKVSPNLFSDQLIIAMMTLGVTCLVFGGAFNTYFTLKVTEKLDKEAADLRQQATALQTESQSLWKNLIGGGGKPG
jgi:hypothetical protein